MAQIHDHAGQGRHDHDGGTVPHTHDDYQPLTIAVEVLDALIAFEGSETPVMVLETGDEPWLSTLVGAKLVDGILVLITAEASRPASPAELAARADLVGAP
jgi:hypothetical protein